MYMPKCNRRQDYRTTKKRNPNQVIIMINKLLNDRSDETLVAYSTLTLRVSLGIIILVHVLAKPFVFTMPGTIAYFE